MGQYGVRKSAYDEQLMRTKFNEDAEDDNVLIGENVSGHAHTFPQESIHFVCKVINIFRTVSGIFDKK